ncbi:GSCFA domain-containing protein [Flavobacterium quisquiliarum]|uniref:GSCFA domain-containing protein n=1 Tax=Flavobacterium quisquiliarum TaxID=1834436 RepID=A0ABV8W3J7_9FLAO|nr:GSCFA domain-containing protein [Flavobacterium quisquiliarum]MBW1656863.1 GSCFA domain-containing protein [Flavobacterium quisquiliarum]NWK99521.1 GSCFA domain-containing protein [Flavobacterium collinsii]
MQFRTQILISKSNSPIDYHSKVLSMGSCFAENMAEKFDYFKFQNETNPFGIIFNPVSIEKLFKRVCQEQWFEEKDVFFHNERWHSFEVHSDLSNADRQELLETLNKAISETNKQLKEATHLIITFGTSWIYKVLEKDEVVANCHKVPQKQFSKELLSVEVIQKSIQNTIDLVQALNPKINFIFTISPVRHIKDGFVENQLSKSHLFTALHSVLKTEHSKLNTAYFPSYEIMMDELRDYRFYGEDMLHPNQIAIDYIWKLFSENYISENSLSTMLEVDEIQKSLRHRSFNPESEQHQKFLAKLQQKINLLEKKISHIKF